MDDVKLKALNLYIRYFGSYETDVNDEYYQLIKDYLEELLEFNVFELNKEVTVHLSEDKVDYKLIKNHDNIKFIRSEEKLDNPILVKELKKFNKASLRD